jgi:hypothetical protein
VTDDFSTEIRQSVLLRDRLLTQRLEEAQAAFEEAQRLKADPPRTEEEVWAEQIQTRLAERARAAEVARMEAAESAWDMHETMVANGSYPTPRKIAEAEADLLNAYGPRPVFDVQKIAEERRQKRAQQLAWIAAFNAANDGTRRA